MSHVTGNFPSHPRSEPIAQRGGMGNYKPGYSDCAIATHLKRTAESEAAFLLPHIKKTDHLLDVGCGPGTITTGLAKYAKEGTVIGMDISPYVIQKARELAAEAGMPTHGPGSVVFEEGNILDRLAYPDNTFDIVYCSQVFQHLKGPDMPLRALREIRRVLKPDGILATRDTAGQRFYPRNSGLDRLWEDNMRRAADKGEPDVDPTGPRMPALLRAAGFDVDGGQVHIGAGTRVFSGSESRKWLAWRAAGQLSQGEPLRQAWIDAGISEDAIQQALCAFEKWAETQDAWVVALQCEMLAWN